MNKKYLKKKKVLLAAFASATALSLSACGATELTSDNSNIDMLDTTNTQDDENLPAGGVLAISQELDVNEEDFKILLNYSCENGKDWRITDTKYLYMAIKTKNLPQNKEIYIDNIHSDTSIVSTKARYDGIIQDTMDDRIHNSLMLGFPISNDNSYYGCNVIEGQNSEFIEGWTHGSQGYNSGQIYQKRRLESDFLEQGVYANRIMSVIDLIIVDKNTNEQRAVSVSTEILVRVNNRITFLEKEGYVTYEYDMEGNRTKIEVSPSRNLTK